mmetsp:Transcript_6782/g.11656  ORF Transcript_6782/g.11656 Transcript_6782/m.11656 type:complete len:383 (+) Transcript_6782:90-1238(+)|eukprot:CAMPEP_0196657022 /NCGR_PEP_ID=MMETSP1086-20130531/21282_1 /TAXON_ID=77921 /ORGANISM="Cyanoptyche  gloeocystis , Strain SAG4.97" /LENGTH=382 /DNA_ID=CAMNT_0041990007 /DNA_START=81 /DNA_END=1229 /DNA_ORIENTATION=-
MSSLNSESTTVSRKTRLLAFLVVIVGSLVGGANGVIVKLSNLGSFAFAFWSNLLILPLYATGLAFETYQARRSPATRCSLHHAQCSCSVTSVALFKNLLLPKPLLIGIGWAIAAGIAAAAATSLYFNALTYSLVAVANFLYSLFIIFIPLFSLFILKERLPLPFYAGAALTVAGVVLLVCGESLVSGSFTVDWMPDFEALLSAVGFALATIFMKKATPYIRTWAIVFTMTCAALIVLAICGFIFDPTFQNLPPSTYEWIVLIISAVFQVVPHVCMAKALRYLSASLCGVTSALQDLSSSFFAYVVLGETLGWIEIIGLGLGVVGVGVSSVTDNELSALCCRKKSSVDPTPSTQDNSDVGSETLLKSGFVRSTDLDASPSEKV